MAFTQLSVSALRVVLEEAVSFEFNLDKHEEIGGFYEIDGLYYKVKYPNGYGASIVKHHYSYGGDHDKWELAVLNGSMLCYSTPITDDVVPYLDDEEVCELCRRIRNLPPS